MGCKINSYSRQDRKAAGGACRQIWKREAAEYQEDLVGCWHCGEQFEFGDVRIARAFEDGNPVFCSVACGALFERIGAAHPNSNRYPKLKLYVRDIFAFEGAL